MPSHDDTYVRTEALEGGVVVVTPVGDVDMSRSPDLRHVIQSQFERSGLRRLVIDLDEVGYMDSSGLATLVEAMRTAKKNAVELVLASLSPRVRSLFEIAKLDTVFEISGSREEAIGV